MGRGKGLGEGRTGEARGGNSNLNSRPVVRLIGALQARVLGLGKHPMPQRTPSHEPYTDPPPPQHTPLQGAKMLRSSNPSSAALQGS